MWLVLAVGTPVRPRSRTMLGFGLAAHVLLRRVEAVSRPAWPFPPRGPFPERMRGGICRSVGCSPVRRVGESGALVRRDDLTVLSLQGTDLAVQMTRYRVGRAGGVDDPGHDRQLDNRGVVGVVRPDL